MAGSRRARTASPSAVEVEHGFKQDRISAFETPTDGFTFVNASISWKPWGAASNTSLMLSANNIFDVEARRAASVLKDYAPLPGRDIRVTARIQIRRRRILPSLWGKGLAMADRMHPAPEATPASRRLPWPILIGAGFALFLLALIWFGHELVEGDGAAMDRAIMLAMRSGGHPIGPARLPSAVRDVTALGSTTVLSFLVMVSAVFLWLAGRLRTALLLVGATALGSLTVETIKALVSRSRPDLVGRLMEETSKSFPSGHAALSAIVYLTLATLLFPVLPGRRIRAFVRDRRADPHRLGGREPGLSRRALAEATSPPAGRSAAPGRCCGGGSS